MKRAAFALLLLLSSNTNLHAQAPFYQGQTVRIIVGYLAGDAYDLWARIFAQYMGKYMPGNPSFIVQNMTGGGGLIAANYVYGIAKPDGLTLGALGPWIYFDQLAGRKEVQFDWSKFTWIGTPEQTDSILVMRMDSPYKSIEAIRKAAEPPKCGAPGTSTTSYYVPKFLEENIGSKFNIVTGYPGGNEVDLAIERGELHCRTMTISTYFAREPYLTWHKNGFVRPLMQTPKKRDGRIPDVQTIHEVMDQYKVSEAGRRLATVLLAPAVFGRPMVAAPGVPPARVKILRDAYHRSLKDPGLLEELKKRRWVVDAIGGEEMAALAKEVIAQPPEIIERMKKLLGS